MNIVIISDTHGKHQSLGTLAGDVLIHCGDVSLSGSETSSDIENLDRWFSRQAFRLILCIGGNHDFELEQRTARKAPIFRHATYLVDQAVAFEGVRFYGAPWVPELRQWAHYQDPLSLARKWAAIPEATDVLVTHTPPFGILDRSTSGKQCGCPMLRERLKALRPRLHCFGHIHASAGMEVREGTAFVNASMVDRNYNVVRQPHVFVL